MENNRFTKEIYDDLKQKLSKNGVYETLLYLILQVEYGIENDDLFLIKFRKSKIISPDLRTHEGRPIRFWEIFGKTERMV